MKYLISITAPRLLMEAGDEWTLADSYSETVLFLREQLVDGKQKWTEKQAMPEATVIYSLASKEDIDTILPSTNKDTVIIILYVSDSDVAMSKLDFDLIMSVIGKFANIDREKLFIYYERIYV